MKVKEFEHLYTDLYEVAWNTEYIDKESEKYVKAVRIATALSNDCNVQGGTLVRTVLFNWKTEIKIIKARNQYFCTNNEKHIIHSGKHYARIADNGPGSWRDASMMCISCVAKILITILTNFPPTGRGANYIYSISDILDEGL